MAQVSLILLDDVENLGLAGDEVHVAPGYARNFLLPRKLAAKATPGALRLVESRKAAIAARRAQELENAKALAAKLGEIELSIAMQATEDDQLFGSVQTGCSESDKRAGSNAGTNARRRCGFGRFGRGTDGKTGGRIRFRPYRRRRNSRRFRQHVA